jgi:flagellar protein FlaJ
MENEPEKEPENEKTSDPGLIKRLAITGQLTRFVVYLSTAIPTIIFLVLALFAAVGFIEPATFGEADEIIYIGTSTDFLLIAIFIFTGVFGTYEFIRLKRIRKIDDRFPDFVRDLAESRRAGMTFTKAIMYSSEGNYGVLTPEIQKIARQISWGSSVDNALKAFARRIDTKLISRAVSLIIEASRSGGNVADVLDAASRDTREIKLIESERRANMLSYVAVIYVGMGVFMLIIIILCKSLLPSMLGQGAEQASQAYAISGIGGGGGITQKAITEVFFYAALIQSFGMGIVTGVFEEGNMISGVKHTFIMMLVTWLIFKLLITGI